MRRAGIYASAALLLALVLAPFVLLGTATGARWLARVAEGYLPLELRGVEGSVLSGLQLEGLGYADDGVDLRLESVQLVINLRCALRSVICVESLAIEDLALMLASTGPAKEEGDTLAALKTLPSFDLREIRIAHSAVEAGGRIEQVRDLQLGASLGAGGVFIDRLAACHDQACIAAAGSVNARGAWSVGAEVTLGKSVKQTLADADLTMPETFVLDGSGAGTSAQMAVSSPDDASFGADLRLDLQQEPKLFLKLRDVNQIVPAIGTSPWTQLSGTLEAEVLVRDSVIDVMLNEQLSGYADASLPLTISASYADEVLTLVRAELGSGSEPTLRLQGDLGRLDDLRLDLTFVANDLRLPDAAGLHVGAIAGRGAVALRLDEAATSWSVDVDDLTAGEGSPRADAARQSEQPDWQREWRGSGSLRAAPHSPLPLGELSFELTDADFAPEPLAFTYVRTDAERAAVLTAPEGVTLEDLSLDTLQVALQPGNRNELSVNASGDVTTELALTFSFDETGAQGDLAPFSVVSQGVTISSAEPVAFEWRQASDIISLGALCLDVRQSRVCSQPADLGPQGSLALTLELQDSYRGTLADKTYSIEGEASGSVALVWADWLPTEAQLDLELPRLAFDPFVAAATASAIEWRDGRITGSYGPLASKVGVALQSMDLGSLDVAIEMDAGRLEGRLTTEDLELAALSDFLPEVVIASGVASADVRVQGTLDAPVFDGSASISGANIGVDSFDTALEALDLTATLEGREGSVRGEGILGGGKLGFEAACCADGRIDGTLIGARNRLQLPLGLDLTLSPSLDFTLDPELLSVTGSLAVHDGVFEHSGLADGGVAVSPDIIRVDTPEVSARRFDLNLDLRALIEPGFVLRSRQLESTLGGDLRFLMPPRTPPTLFGNLEVLGGELRAYGQALRLTEGSLGFVGDPLNPDLSINAEREIRADNQRVGFRVRGSLEEPLFELFSDPQRSNDETLSYLLRGRPPDVGVSADGTSMALSLGASAVNQSGVLSSLNSIPGLSGVSLGAEGRDEEMAATISAYVGNRLYLSYGVGIYEPINALTARLYLRSRLWLEVVSRLESSLDLFYRFDRN